MLALAHFLLGNRTNRVAERDARYQEEIAMQSNKSTEHTVDHLNSFLRGEISAVETYRQALSRLDSFAYRSTLEQCARSHEQRVQLLADEVPGP